MEAIVTQPQAQPHKTPFADLLKPLTPVSETPAPAPQSQSNDAPGASGAVPSGSAAGQAATATQNEAFASLKHTDISSVSGSAVPGQTGTIPPGAASPQASVSLGGLVQGEWAVNIMDALLPAAFVAGLYALGMKVRKSELQLTQGEKQTIAPIMQKCLDQILINFNNPWNALAVTVGAIYGGKLMEKGLIQWIDKSQEKQQDDVLKQKIAAAEVAADPAKHDYANASAVDIQSGAVAHPGNEPEFTEAQIKANAKKWQCSRARALARMKREAQKQAA